MNLLQALQQLRDDLKNWVTNNLNALNAKIDKNSMQVDDKLDSTSTNPVQNKVVTSEIDDINKRVGDSSVANQISNAIAKQSHFSGNYNDLTDAPNISEDEDTKMIIIDEDGNMIFKADADGIHTTNLTLNGKLAATEKYVDEAISKIPETDLSNYLNKEEVETAIETAKKELGESIESADSEWNLTDNQGNIILKVDASGVHTTDITLNGESVATEQWVENKNYLTEHQDISGKSDIGHKHVITDIKDLPEYATKDYIDTSVANLVNSAPEALNTLGELAIALENHEDAYDALLENVGSKTTIEDLENLKNEMSESISSESEEFYVVDNEGNIIASIDARGITTTTIAANDIILDGNDLSNELDNLSLTITNHIESESHVSTKDRNSWNNKVDAVEGKGLSTNDFTDDYKNTLDNLDNITFNEIDPTVPAWAKEPNKPTYTASEIGLGNVNNTADVDKPVSTATQTALDNLKTELSESIVSESNEWKVMDEDGNIILTVTSEGVETTAINIQSLILNGEQLNTEGLVNKVITALPKYNGEVEEV